MASQKISIDFKKMSDSITHYFSSLSQDMMIAWGAIGLGIVLIIIALFIL